MFKRLLVILSVFLTVNSCQLPEPSDIVPPVTLLLFPYDGAIISENIQARIEATDAEAVVKVSLYLDGNLVGTATKEPFLVDMDITGLQDKQEHVAQATAEDKEGNIGYSPLVRFIISDSDDIIPPSVSLLNPQPGQVVAGMVRITATAVDERSIQKVAFFIDGDSVGLDASYPYHYNWNSLPWADSLSHVIYAKAFDGGGNSTISAPVTVSVFPSSDQTAPSSQITYPLEGQTVRDTVEVRVEASDNKGVSLVELYIDGVYYGSDSNAPYAFSWDTAPYLDGQSHSLFTKVYDLSGNSSQSPIVTVLAISDSTVDVTAPIVYLASPLPGQVIYQPITVAAEATDDGTIEKVEFYFDGQLLATDNTFPYSLNWDPTSIADNSNHSLYARAYDAGGNVGSSGLTTIFLSTGNSNDLTPPTVAVLYPLAGIVVSGTITVSGDAQDNEAVTKVEFYIDGQLKATDTSPPYNYSWNTAAYADGQLHSVYLKAYDAAGNVGSSAVVTVTVQ